MKVLVPCMEDPDVAPWPKSLKSDRGRWAVVFSGVSGGAVGMELWKSGIPTWGEVDSYIPVRSFIVKLGHPFLFVLRGGQA